MLTWIANTKKGVGVYTKMSFATPKKKYKEMMMNQGGSLSFATLEKKKKKQ